MPLALLWLFVRFVMLKLFVWLILCSSATKGVDRNIPGNIGPTVAKRPSERLCSDHAVRKRCRGHRTAPRIVALLMLSYPSKSIAARGVPPGGSSEHKAPLGRSCWLISVDVCMNAVLASAIPTFLWRDVAICENVLIEDVCGVGECRRRSKRSGS